MGFSFDDAITGGLGGLFAGGGLGGAGLGALFGGFAGGADTGANLPDPLRLGGPIDPFINNVNSNEAQLGQARNIRGLTRFQGRTDPELFNRILAGSSRATESSQSALRSRGARSGLDSGIQDALAAAIDLEGADRESGIRAQEASLAEQRRRGDIGLVNSALIDPILAALGIQSGVSTSRANIEAQQGNQGLQAIATLLGGLSNLRG